MSDTLKQYRDVLFIINEESKPESKHNKLLKLQLATEDEILRALLNDVVRGYRAYVPPRWRREGYPANFNEWVEYMKPLKKNLKEYTEGVLVTAKPQWQILAERNGWRPPV